MTNHSQPPIFGTGNIKDTKISLFKSITEVNPKNISLEDLLRMIRDGELKAEIELLRQTTNPADKDRIKKNLPGVTVSGLFKDGRKAGNLETYSGLMQIDFDKLDNPEADFKELIKDPYTLSAFISPSGNGLKLIVRVAGTEKEHKGNFGGLADYYLKRYGLVADPACKDVSRLMFLNCDPEIYFNPDSLPWSQETAKNEKFENILNYIKRNVEFKSGTRNEFIFKLALECSAKKMNCEFVNSECLKRFLSDDFTEFEISNTVKSAYSYPANAPKSDYGRKTTKLSIIEDRISEWYELRLNEIANRIEYRIQGSKDPYKELNENSLWRKLAFENIDVPITKLANLLRSDFVETYHPFLEYFTQLEKYDENTEPDYIQDLCMFIKTKDQERFNRHFRKMLVRTIACAIDKDVFNKQAFILVQEAQNSGKSTFCRWLNPPFLSEYITENISTDKDSLIALSTNFLINLDELATLGKAEINMVKSLFSQDTIKARLPYDRRASTRPRCASFVGSTNQNEFLTDESGSVRWLCFVIESIDFNYKLKIRIDDIWKQAYHLYLAGFPYQLTPAEVKENEIANKDFQRITAEREFIQEHFSPGTKEQHYMFVTATNIQQFGSERNLKLHPQMIGRALKLLEFDHHKKFNGQYQIKGYYIKLNKPGSFTLIT